MEVQTQQEESKFKFPTEEVTLPSKGLLYPEDSPLSKGVIEMKYMTAKEEDILTNQNLIKKGTVVDKLLQSLIITPINYNDLLIGDKNAILIAARILGYGSEYTFKYPHPKTGVEEEITVDLSDVEDKIINEDLIIEGRNEFEFTLPHSKIVVTFKLLTHGDETKMEAELKGLQRINKGGAELTTRLKHMLLSINGDTERKTIREFVDTALLARDSRSLREYAKTVMPDVDLIFDFEAEDGHVEEGVQIPIGVSFFWPDF